MITRRYKTDTYKGSKFGNKKSEKFTSKIKNGHVPGDPPPLAAMFVTLTTFVDDNGDWSNPSPLVDGSAPVGDEWVVNCCCVQPPPGFDDDLLPTSRLFALVLDVVVSVTLLLILAVYARRRHSRDRRFANAAFEF